MPDRIIKESILTSEDVNKMTDFQFRVWVSLITYVDDCGRGDARPAVIKGKCFPLRDRMTFADIDAALEALAGIGCVCLYEVDGKPYLCFPTWESHQNVRETHSKFPPPAKSKTEEKTDAKRKPFTPPTIEEVRDYAKLRGSSVDVQKFYDYFQAGNWIDSEGKPVRSWKQKFITWEKFNEGRGRDGRTKPLAGNAQESVEERKSKWGIKYDNE